MIRLKRIVLWLLGTVTVVTLLFGHRTSTQGPLGTTGPAMSSARPGSGDVRGAQGSGGGASGSGDGGGTAAASAHTVTGSVVQTRWGPVQVQVTIGGDKITDVAVLQYPNDNARDQQINAHALPILVQETLDAQSAAIDMVSGATVTSDGYIRSLQAALDKAGL